MVVFKLKLRLGLFKFFTFGHHNVDNRTSLKNKTTSFDFSPLIGSATIIVIFIFIFHAHFLTGHKFDQLREVKLCSHLFLT